MAMGLSIETWRRHLEPISLLMSTQTMSAKPVRSHSHIVLLMASALITITMATTFLCSDTETHEGSLWLPTRRHLLLTASKAEGRRGTFYSRLARLKVEGAPSTHGTFYSRLARLRVEGAPLYLYMQKDQIIMVLTLRINYM